MIKLYICCLVVIIGSVEVGPDIDMKFHQEAMEIVSYDRRIIRVNLNLQEEIIDADIDHNLGAVHTPGLRDPHDIRRDPGDHI